VHRNSRSRIPGETGIMWKGRNRKKKSEQHLDEAVKLPKDVVYGSLIVTLTGNQEAYIENYRALLGYTEDTIVIQEKKETVTFRGEAFLIQYFTNDDMKITGKISEIEYHG
jgi:sporulation protein YqfC